MNRPLVPDFIKKFDRQLLLTKPSLWSTRVHFVLYYSIIFMAVLGLLCLLTTVEPTNYSQIGGWISFTGLVCFVGLVVWMIFLLRFNVFKRFGVQKAGDGIITFLLLFVGMFFIVLPGYVPPAIESVKANMRFGSNEIVSDVNSINEKLCQLNYTKLSGAWDRDTLQLTPANGAPEEAATDLVKDNRKRKEYVSSMTLKDRLSYADSSVKLSNDLYVIYHVPGYAFVGAQEAATHSTVKLNSSMDIYHYLMVNFKPVDKIRVAAELNALLKKYKYSNLYSGNYYTDGSDYISEEAKIMRSYQLSDVDTGIRNISDKKYRFEMSNFKIYFRIIFYISFCISLLLFIFRHSTVKTFFLSLLTAIVLFIFSALIVVFSGSHDETVIFTLMLFYYIVFALIALSINVAKTRTAFQGIALNLVTFFITFLPLIITVFYYEQLDRLDRYGNYVNYDYEKRNTHYLIAEITGVVILIVLLEPVFKKLYRKWYALPED